MLAPKPFDAYIDWLSLFITTALAQVVGVLWGLNLIINQDFMKWKIRIFTLTCWFCSWQCHKQSSWTVSFKVMLPRGSHNVPKCLPSTHNHPLVLVDCGSPWQPKWGPEKLPSTCTISGPTYRCNWSKCWIFIDLRWTLISWKLYKHSIGLQCKIFSRSAIIFTDNVNYRAHSSVIQTPFSLKGLPSAWPCR